jgi:glutamine amidotransferase
MCLATLTLDGATLTDEQIRTAWCANSDGGGIAYFDGNGKVQAFRTLSLDKFLRGYERLISEGVHERPMAIHFRLATHGDRTIANVHPFRMDEHTMVIHNGMFPIETTASRSDTSIFVQDVLPKLGPLWMDDDHLHAMVHAYCDSGYTNKLVVLTSNPNATHRAYIVNSSAGHWNDAKTIWFSNRSYVSSPTRWTTPSRWSAPTSDANAWIHEPNETWDAPSSSGDALDECAMCGEDAVAWLDDNGAPTCLICGTCQTCAFDYMECTCGGASLHSMTDNQFALFDA